MTVPKQNPFELFQEEFPELAARFNDLVEAQKSQKGLDSKTKQLVNIAILTAHHSGLTSVLKCLPAAIDGFEGKLD